jgi:hypothetical protein
MSPLRSNAAVTLSKPYGIHRADAAEPRARREAFVEELLSTIAIYPLTTDIARLAGWMPSNRGAAS